jgi:PhnB protein
MTSLRPYLHFDGTTRQAMEFYKDVLGGELEVMTIGDTPWAADMETPSGVKPDKNKVMHSALTTKDVTIMAADMMDPSSFKTGDNVSLCLVCDSKSQIETVFEKLSKGGDVFQALDKAPFGWFANFTDKYGIDWMLQYQGE